MELSIRQVQRLLYALKKEGDKAVVHELRGKVSNRKIEEKVKRQAAKILSARVFSLFIAGQVLKFHTITRMRFAPPEHRTPDGS